MDIKLKSVYMCVCVYIYTYIYYKRRSLVFLNVLPFYGIAMAFPTIKENLRDA